MASSTELLIPENDPSIQRLLGHGVWEVPHQAVTHRGTILSDMTPRLNGTEIEISDEYFESHRNEFPEIIDVYYAKKFMEHFGAGELLDHESMPKVRIIYNGVTNLDPRYNLNNK